MTLQRRIELAGAALTRSAHVCAFFNSRDEEYKVLLPFARDGFQARDRLVQVVDRTLRPERLARLQQAGIDVAKAQERDQLDVQVWEDAYLRPGYFDHGAMLALIEGILKHGRERGFPLTRLWANMEWALEDAAGVEDIVEYETRLNFLLPKYDDAVVCSYDLNRFTAKTVVAVLRTHPQVIVGGVLQENPFYVPPADYLRELRGGDRHRRPSAAE